MQRGGGAACAQAHGAVVVNGQALVGRAAVDQQRQRTGIGVADGERDLVAVQLPLLVAEGAADLLEGDARRVVREDVQIGFGQAGAQPHVAGGGLDKQRVAGGVAFDVERRGPGIGVDQNEPRGGARKVPDAARSTGLLEPDGGGGVHFPDMQARLRGECAKPDMAGGRGDDQGIVGRPVIDREDGSVFILVEDDEPLDGIRLDAPDLIRQTRWPDLDARCEILNDQRRDGGATEDVFVGALEPDAGEPAERGGVVHEQIGAGAGGIRHVKPGGDGLFLRRGGAGKAEGGGGKAGGGCHERAPGSLGKIWERKAGGAVSGGPAAGGPDPRRSRPPSSAVQAGR